MGLDPSILIPEMVWHPAARITPAIAFCRLPEDRIDDRAQATLLGLAGLQYPSVKSQSLSAWAEFHRDILQRFATQRSW